MQILAVTRLSGVFGGTGMQGYLVGLIRRDHLPMQKRCLSDMLLIVFGDSAKPLHAWTQSWTRDGWLRYRTQLETIIHRSAPEANRPTGQNY